MRCGPGLGRHAYCKGPTLGRFRSVFNQFMGKSAQYGHSTPAVEPAALSSPPVILAVPRETKGDRTHRPHQPTRCSKMCTRWGSSLPPGRASARSSSTPQPAGHRPGSRARELLIKAARAPSRSASPITFFGSENALPVITSPAPSPGAGPTTCSSPCRTSTCSSSIRRAASLRKDALLRLRSTRMNCSSGRAAAQIKPGSPAPEPMSSTPPSVQRANSGRAAQERRSPSSRSPSASRHPTSR